MFNKDFFDFLYKVLTSWEIIAVSVVLIIYFSLVSHVARLYHFRPSSLSFNSKKPKKEKKSAAQVPETSEDEDLGLEE